MTKILDNISCPNDLKKLKKEELGELSGEIRDYLVEAVSKTGGHLASSLGAVELTVALHYTYKCPDDKIIWDVGHQSYAHKLLTGRKDCFHTLRCIDGISGFPKRHESEYDAFGTGHSSTSISAAVGLGEARKLNNEKYKVVAVIGDGALTGGMAYEALNHAGSMEEDITVVLNDNNMSIGRNVGGMSAYLNRIRSSPRYRRLKEKVTNFLHRIPVIGPGISKLTSRIKLGFKYFVVPGILFEELGFTYLGPVDGHQMEALTAVLQRARIMKGPVLVHVITQKGKGYRYAEEEPSQFHGVGPFNHENGYIEKAPIKIPSYTDVFGETLVELASEDPRIVAITAAMTSGTGLDKFAKKYPRRFYDVGIAEQHAVTMAGGLAAGGMKPVAAIYSTFMQRAYDQTLHDLGVQKLPVILALDRAGIVGSDGETHQGVFDISFLRHIPNMALMAPKDENELRKMLKTAIEYEEGPVAIRYPRAPGENGEKQPLEVIPWGKSELLRDGEDILIIAAGTMVKPSLQAAAKLANPADPEGGDAGNTIIPLSEISPTPSPTLSQESPLSAAVLNARFIKPLDAETILNLARKSKCIVTVEENVLAGGFGSAVLELLQENNLTIPVKCLGIGDTFVKHGTRDQLLIEHGLDKESIYRSVLEFFHTSQARQLKPEPQTEPELQSEQPARSPKP